MAPPPFTFRKSRKRKLLIKEERVLEGNLYLYREEDVLEEKKTANVFAIRLAEEKIKERSFPKWEEKHEAAGKEWRRFSARGREKKEEKNNLK